MKRLTVAALLGWAALFVPAFLFTQIADSASSFPSARKARDEGNVPALQEIIQSALAEARRRHTAQAYEQLALLDSWLCEAGYVVRNSGVVKQAAEAGVEAAQVAVSLDPKSSEAHRLESELLGQLIPQTFAGGMRYGTRWSREVQRAIELNPENANAYTARGIGYLSTPRGFGGGSERAVADLKKAVALEPASDTAHIWLAQAYRQTGKRADAMREIKEALSLNPNRGFAKWVYAELASGRSH